MALPAPIHAMRRRRALALGGAALLLAGSGCGRAEPLRIGFLGGMSGRVADLGVGGRNGAQLAVDDLNAAGGVLGRPVELLARDDEQNDDVARRRLLELIDAGVALVVGPMTSSVAVAVAPLAEARKMALVSPTSTTNELSRRADAFFRVVSDAPTGAAQQAEWLFRNGRRSLATLADLNNRAFSQSWSQGAARRFDALGGRVVLEAEFTSAPGLAYAALAHRLADTGADVVLLAANAADSALLIQQVRQRNPQVQLAVSPWGGTAQLLQMGGRAVEGTLVPQYYDVVSRAEPYLAFVERFQLRFGEAPGYPAVNGHDALMLGVEAVRRRQGAQSVLDTMRTLRQHPGLQRMLDLDEFGDSRAPLFLTRVRDGRFVPAERG